MIEADKIFFTPIADIALVCYTGFLYDMMMMMMIMMMVMMMMIMMMTMMMMMIIIIIHLGYLI